jgi:hypothetical protein
VTDARADTRGRCQEARPRRDPSKVTSIIDFADAVRALCGRPHRRALPLANCERDSDERCVVAAALGVSVGESAHPSWAVDGRWVMRFADPATARRVGIGLDQPWRAEPAEVLLPDALVNLAVSHHYGVVVPDDGGDVRGWWLPGADGLPVFCTPTDPLIDNEFGRDAGLAAEMT